MSVKVNFDTAGNVELPTLVLAYKNGSKIGVIQNATSIVKSNSLADASSISFRVYKYFDDNVYSDWDKLTDFKLLHNPENNTWYSLTVDVDVNDETVKNVNGTTLGESELSQVNLYDVEINTETDISREDYDKDLPTVFYRPKHPEASLMDRITEKVPNYTIKHVDASLMNIQKTFSFNGISINDAFKEIGEEIGCLILISSGSDKNGKPERGIYAYDLEDTCLDCGYRNTAIGIDMTRCPKCGSENISNGYGEDTTIFVTKDNLADSIEYTTNSGSVKNCFKLVAGDDLMTATVRACNPNGSDYIWMFSESMKDDMSKPLKDKIAEYDKLYNEYQTKASIQLSSNLLTEYNKLINKYKTYAPTLEVIPNSVIGYPQLMKVYFETVDMVLLLNSTLMPNITLPELNAKQQLDKLMSEIPSAMGTTSISGLSQSTADNIVLSYARSVVYSGFKVEINRSSLSGTTWSGSFVVTSYSDKNDTATSGSNSIIINDNYEQYIKQRLDKILNKEDKNLYGITGLFKQSDDIFKSELRKYSLSRLNSFYSACQACIDIMVQAKISEKDGKHKDVYTELYVPYLNKLQFISDEIKVRDNEIRIVQGYYNNKGVLVAKGLQQELIEKRDEIQKVLNFETFLGKELWNEFLSFRREDEYSNNNYISDGLSNAELFKNAKEFISKATKELYKSCHLQHSITSTLKNFLRMKEFSPILDYFELGNWIRVEIDEKIYKLRLIDYEIDYEDLDNISVTFSDVERVYDGYSDLQSIYDKTSSLATSYDSVKHQIDSNKDNLNRLDNWVAKGLDMTNMKIVSNADNQDIMWDDHGLLCREYNDILDDYNPEQLKVINNGIYVTDDNWKHSRTGFGQFIYFDPKDGKYKEGYGVIADTIVSNIILSEEVGIYNTEKSIEMGKNGIVVTTNTMNKNVFTIQKEYTDEKGDVFTERQLYIDDNGNIVLGGGASISWDNITGTDHIVTDVDAEKLKNDITAIFSQKLDILEQQIDGKADTWYQSNDPSVDWNTPELKNNHIGDLWYKTDTDETFMYNGNGWDAVTGEVPQELWDRVDGKAQIFTTTIPPTPPYHKGDLWFAGADADIKTCITARESGSYVESDWKKYNKYTDDTKVDDVISGLGFTTSITGNKVISPHIVGGNLKIGNPNSGTYYASIDTSGKLTATGADIKGKIVATEGMIGNFNISNAIWNGMNSFNSGNNGVYLGTDGIALGGGKFKVTSGGKLTASGVDISGNINADDGTFRGTIYAQDGSFKGAITATSLTLLPGVTIDYSDISNKPEIPSVDRFISKDGIVGTTPSDGSTGFKVSSSGLLEASNAIIYGTIYASSGTIGGFNITSVKNDNDHAYGQTLYRQVKRVYENGSYYDYQAGIKGSNTNSSSTEATEAAFYIRKKLSSDTWANSTIPFYVRNNGYVYAENMNIGNTLYSTGVQRSENGLEDKRYKVMEAWVEKVAFGMLDNAYDNYATFDKTGTYLWSKGKAVKVVYDEYERYIELSPELDTTVAYLGNAFETWKKLYVQNIGDTGTPVNSGYFTNLYTKVNGVWTKVTGTSGGGTTTPTYTAGDGINISSNRISVTLAGEDSGGLKFNNYGNITISTSFLNSRYSQINHTHSSSSITWSGLKSSNGDNNGHVHRGINNSSGYGLWINGSTMIYPASNADGGLNTTTVTDLNSGIDLGGRTVPFKGGYFKKLYLRNTDIESLFYLSVSGNTLYLKNNIDNSTISNVTLPSGGGTSNYNDLSGKPSINSVTLSGNQTLDNLGIGSRLSLYGTTLHLEKSNGSTISSVNLSSLSGGGGSSGLTTIQGYHHLSSITEAFWVNCGGKDSLRLGNNGKPFLASPATYDYKISNASPLYINANGTIGLSSSSKRYKHDIRKINFSDLSGLYELPIYLYKYNDDYFSDPNDTGRGKDFIGFIAEDVESINPKLVEYKDGKVEMWSHIQMTPALLALIQNNHKEIQKLKNTILQLQGELSVLKQNLGGI